MKQVHDLQQGSDAWHQFRFEHDGASEAAAMLGLSRVMKRNDLLRVKKTGIAKVFTDWVQENVLDYGHEVEALARPIIGKEFGVEFYPVTCSDGQLSASCDGLDMADELAMEHKQWNDALAARVRTGAVPLEHMPQCQQILMVTKAERLVFVVSDGTREKMVWCIVMPDPEWFERIRAGWAQFHADLANYVPTEPVVELVGRTPETLPALHIVLKGEVSASNLAEFKEIALTAIRSVNRDLKTDQDFADSAKARKWCEDIEARVAGAKEHALSQTMSIDLLFRTMDEVSAEARDVRLALEKLEKARKESRRGEIVAGGVAALREHIASLHKRTEGVMPYPSVDFGAAIKGLRTFDSMQNAVDTVLANAKIAASATADRIQANLTTLREQATEFKFLFPDTQVIVQKAPDDFASLVKARIAEHQAAEAKKEEAQRERIRQEELQRIERERQAEERKRIASEAAAAAAKPVAAPAAAPMAAPAPAVVAMPRRAEPAAAAQPTLSLGAIKERIAPLSLTADGLATLGFVGQKERGSVLYHEADFPHMCAAIVQHVEAIYAKQAA